MPAERSGEFSVYQPWVDAEGSAVPSSREPQRADALKNREHILAVAHDAFAETGTTSLNEIAKRAGVDAGTLYRHFPTREALILAVYQHDVQRLVDSVEQVLAVHEPMSAEPFAVTSASYVFCSAASIVAPQVDGPPAHSREVISGPKPSAGCWPSSCCSEATR